MRPIANIKLSQQAKGQLIKMKRLTGLKQWNVLCRWAFCTSMAEPSVPPAAKIPADSNVEMSWKVFGGDYEAVYLALLKLRCHEDGLGTDSETLAEQFRLHLHRGIGYLAADRSIASIADLIAKLPTVELENGEAVC